MSKMRLRGFESASGQRHVSEEDRYLYRQEEPKHRLVVIGTGTMGQEHMRVALRFVTTEHGRGRSQFSSSAAGTLGAI